MDYNKSNEHNFSKDKGSEEKFAKVMREFEAGTLKTSAGVRVTDRNQAVAIAISESKRASQQANQGEEANKGGQDQGVKKPDSTDMRKENVKKSGTKKPDQNK